MPGFCRWWCLAPLGLLACILGCAPRVYAQEPLPWVEGSTTLVLLPDTQHYTTSRPQFFEAQTRWVAANQAKRRIAYAVHMGDITEHDAPQEWDVAKRSLGLLDGHVPYVLVTGNHDYTGGGRQTRLHEYFPPAKFKGWPTFGGVHEDKRLENNYHLLTINERPWLILGLEFAPRDTVVAWANEVLRRHSNRLAIIATHAYLFRDNTRFDHTKGKQRANPHGYAGDGNDGEQLWQKLVARHANVMLVVCGHVRTGGVAYLASEGQHGNVVHQILNDYEAIHGNGQGFLRLLEFHPDGRTVQVKAYSPVLDKYMTDPQNQFRFTLKPSSVPPANGNTITPMAFLDHPKSTTAERLEGGAWQRVPVRTVADVAGLPSLSKETLSKYGGHADGKRLRATGFFRTEQVGRNWTLVDPEGYPFISVGLCSVNLSLFPAGAADKKFGGTTQWAEQTLRLLKECGFNTLGRWSDAATFIHLKERMAYVTTVRFMADYDKQRPRSNGARSFPERTIPVFDKEFPEFCEKLAQSLSTTKDDPWLLGHMSDNELPFRPDGLSCYLRLPASDPGHQAAQAWLAAHHKRADHLTDTDQLAFVAAVAERYYSTVRQAILRYDPNHLYLGSRLNGRNINDGTLRGSRPLDVVSINMYHHWSNDDLQMDRWAELSQRPILNSEWYAMSLASPKVDTKGAGFRVRSHRDRGLFYQNLCLGMLGNRHCVGWHWFKYNGDAQDNFRGFVGSTFEPHRDMTDLMGRLNTRIYPLRAVLLPR